MTQDQEEKIKKEIKKFFEVIKIDRFPQTEQAKIKMALVTLVGVYHETGFDAGVEAIKKQLEEQGIREKL